MRILLIILLLLSPSLALALEYHGENTIYKDTVWQGDVLIDGILTLAMDATLEIRPGTRVRFARYDTNGDGIGESAIFAQGHFQARGTEEHPVIFTSAASNPAPGDWGALNMMMSEDDENLLENCRVEYGYRGFHAHYSKARLRSSVFRHNLRGAQFQESTVTIEGCRFEDNFNGLQFRDSKVRIENSKIMRNHWGIRAVFVDLYMRGNQVEGNLTNGISLRDSKVNVSDNLVSGNRRGIYLQRSSGKLSGNRVLSNHENGIYLEESIADVQGNLVRSNGRSGLKVLNVDGTIESNRIENNVEFTIYNAGDDDFDLGANWYGSSEPRLLLMDGHFREGFGLIKLAPPLTRKPEVRVF